MTTPVVPKGQEIQELLRRVALADLSSTYWTDVEQQIREIIAQEIEDKLYSAPKTLMDLGVFVPIGPLFPTVSDGVMGAANIVRGKTPVTAEQWAVNIANAQARCRPMPEIDLDA